MLRYVFFVGLIFGVKKGFDVGYDYYYSDVVNCDEFFQGSSWPIPLESENIGAVKLCQTKGSSNVVAFATYFSTKYRIPLYTANTVVLFPNAEKYPRPSEDYWERVSLALCNKNQTLPTFPIYSMIEKLHRRKDNCAPYQALEKDYRKNELSLDQGHLSPNAINNQNRLKQVATFTLTNAAPQFSAFNRGSWKHYECATEASIKKLVPGEKVFIVTGTAGSALDNNNHTLWMNQGSSKKSPVKVPGYYWKAVCYPGNNTSGKRPWAYAIIEKNENVHKKAYASAYMTAKQFSSLYFKTPIFGPSCLNAPLGDFGKLLRNEIYADFLHKNCSIVQTNGNEFLHTKDEL